MQITAMCLLNLDSSFVFVAFHHCERKFGSKNIYDATDNMYYFVIRSSLFKMCLYLQCGLSVSRCYICSYDEHCQSLDLSSRKFELTAQCECYFWLSVSV